MNANPFVRLWRKTSRVMLIGWLLVPAAYAATSFYYSVDIGSDKEWCDPNIDGDEAMDPAWIYQPVLGGFTAVKSATLIFPSDPPPNAGAPVPYGAGGPASASSFFDIDGEDQLGLIPGSPQGPLEGPLATEPVWTAGLFLDPPRLFYSLDDDKAPGWWVMPFDVPVRVSPDRGAATNEILKADGWRAWALPGLPAADETALGLGTNPLPMTDDDDVDALDTRQFRYWFWTCDNEADMGLDPGCIYVTDTAAAGPNFNLYISGTLLGLPLGTDLDAFEFCVTDDADLRQAFGLPAAGRYLAVVFSVDQDDPSTTGVDESGGYNPNMIYISLLTGGAPVALGEREDDVDAIALDVYPMDFGDAPPPYPTLRAQDGARHRIGGVYYMGAAVDEDLEGQPDPAAAGDDTDADGDDEDGVSFTSAIVSGQTAYVTVVASTNGALDAWIDFGADGGWAELGDQIFTSQTLSAGANNLSFIVPASAATGTVTFARFRFSSAGGLSYTGYAPDGEVEDYAVMIEEGQEPGPEYKWRQRPDLLPTGMDVDAMMTSPILLADDFRCTQTSTITNIVVWGSWLYDELPLEDPSQVAFHLSIHADVPAGVQAPWSMPGEVLWTAVFGPGSFTVRPEATGLTEGWYDPATSNWVGAADTICWRYEFPIDWTSAFVQTGTVDHPIVYWLDVQATPQIPGGPFRFGWKTSLDHWNDDACWAPAFDPYSGFWWEMRYPPQHPLYPQSIDLAFALSGGPVPEPPRYDFGDAPDPLYPTMATNNGAYHLIAGPWLGDATDAPDSEPDGQPDPNALGDDLLDTNDDEDGVLFPTMIVGLNANIIYRVSNVSGSANVECHIDWNGDGDWNDAGETYAFSRTVAADGVYTNSVPVPLNAARGTTFARVRVSTSWYGPTGYASDGEVEDYAVTIEERFDFGDAPDPLYPTLLASGGAYHIAVGPWLGDATDAPDLDPDGQPDPNALGDDLLDTNDDEDGVIFPNTLVAGTTTNILFRVSNAPVQAYVEIWIDWGADGNWSSPGDYVYAGWHTTGLYTVVIGVPLRVAWSDSFARVRISTQGTGSPTGLAYDGEVEDYKVRLAGIDFGDAPDPSYPTLIANNGACHLLRGTVWMGASVDTETDGQPTPAADGDDTAGLDDEDGVILPTFIRQDRPESLQVVASGACTLNAWIDYNADGDWLDAGEKVFTDVPLVAGTNTLSFVVPRWAAVGTTYARFRVSTVGGLGPSGLADDGEVEDYTLEIFEKFPPTMGVKWRQPPDKELGLNLQSWSAPSPESGISVGPVVADDWWCDGRPIDAIRWWGSYVLYGGPTDQLAVTRPTAFRLSWYVDIPTNALGGAFSRPGQLLKQTIVKLLPYGDRLEAADQVSEKYLNTVPLDFLGPVFEGMVEHKFEYNVVLSEPWMEKNTLSRENYEPPCSSNVYWLSIEAVYDRPPEETEFPWGWETTPARFNWNDDAVAATNTIAGIRTPWNEMRYIPGVWPWSIAEKHPYLGKSVNMAFEMLSTVVGRRSPKWSQLPNMQLGTDMPSWRYIDPLMPPPPWASIVLRADDFVSDGRRITDIHWWGSYVGWQAQYWQDEFEPMPAPAALNERPLGFDLSWHAYDAAANAPGVLITNIFIPMERCHEMYYCTIPQIGHIAYPFEHEYQYYVDLLDERLNTQPWYETLGEHYWLNIQAVFDPSFVPAPFGEAGYDYPHEGWGWKIAGIEPDLRMSRSVVSNAFTSVSWESSALPPWHTFAGSLHDLAFELTTDQTATNDTLKITAVSRSLSAVVTVASEGTSWPKKQYLQRTVGGIISPTWINVETNEAPFPPPAQNIWQHTGATDSNKFYRVIEAAP